MAAEAARQLRGLRRRGQAADIAWAAADVLTAAAEATGSPELQRAADGFSRAARAPWGRIPPPSPGGAGLRTAAYLLATCTPPGTRRRIDRLALFAALAGLARVVAELRGAHSAVCYRLPRLIARCCGPGRCSGRERPGGLGRARDPRLPAARSPVPARGPDQRAGPGRAAPLRPPPPPARAISGRPGPGPVTGRAGLRPGGPHKCHRHPIIEERGGRHARLAHVMAAGELLFAT